MNRNENDNPPEGKAPGIIEALGHVVVGLGILALIDFFLGELWAFVFITLGVFGTFYGSKITASGIMALINRTSSESIKEKIARFWYDNNVSPHSSDRIPNPSREEIFEYIKWRQEQEAKEGKSSEKIPS